MRADARRSMAFSSILFQHEQQGVRLDAEVPQPLSFTTQMVDKRYDPFTEFRHLVSRRARQSAAQWDASRRLIDQETFPTTLKRFGELLDKHSLPASIEECLRLLLQPETGRAQDLDSTLLKKLTGLAPSKAFRALCLYFDLVEQPGSKWPVPAVLSEEIEQNVSRMTSPFDILLQTDVTSVLDLGAGDLSFAGELAALYTPVLRQQHGELILHCVDRLHPGSKLGGPLHPGADQLHSLQKELGKGFAFYGNTDMFDLGKLDGEGKLAPRYTLVTCWAPATPTFAYEPSRLSRPVITKDLTDTKGSFRQARFEGEPALEVQHGQRTLLFPSWKFEVVGPLALLHLMASRGCLCVLGAVDAQVFWELLAQLLENPRYRPSDQPFNSENLPEIFGEVYQALERLPVGESVNLSDLSVLRRQIPGPLGTADSSGAAFSFRSVQIRRGATFPGMPASSTARKFTMMTEEAPPWFLALVPAERMAEYP